MTDTSFSPPRRKATWRTVVQPPVYLPIVSLVVFLSLWEIVGRSINPLLFAPPSRAASAFIELAQTGTLLEASLVTINAVLVGYIAAIVVGIPLGVVLARAKMVGDMLDPYLYGIFSTPRVVIVPLVIVWFGVGYTGRLFLIFLWSMIAIATSTADGVRNARPDLVEVAVFYGAKRAQLVRHVLLPGAVPFVVSGLRIGAERAVVGAVIGEMFLELTGLGGLIQVSAKSFETPQMLVAVATIAVIGTLLISGLDLLEQRVSAWKQTST